MNSLAGQLLVALPDLADTNFFRSVVLLFRHDQEGATGLVLNRRTDTSLVDAVPDLPDPGLADGIAPNDLSRSLYWGGPVRGPLMALHACLPHAELSVLGGVQFSVEGRLIRRIVTQSRHPFRIYSGYCGWAPGQLEAEIGAGGWLVRPAVAGDVFTQEPDALWQLVCERTGLEIMLPDSAPGLRHRGSDPGWN